MSKAVCVFCVPLKAMKMSRRSADASQRALAYNRIVDGLNEFRLGNTPTPTLYFIFYPNIELLLKWLQIFVHQIVHCLFIAGLRVNIPCSLKTALLIIFNSF